MSSLTSKGIIYLITNKVNGLSYIGQTTTSLAKRLSKHKYDAFNRPKGLLHNAIAEHGIECFHMTPLFTAFHAEELDRVEVEFIKEFDTLNNGYNSTLGGKGRRLYENT